MFPDIKKRLKSFVISEKGSISKQSVLAIGAFLTGASVGLVKEVKAGSMCGISACSSDTPSLPSTHANSLKVSYDRQNGIVTTIHSHSVSVNNLPAKGGDGGGDQGAGQDGGGDQGGGQGGQGSSQ